MSPVIAPEASASSWPALFSWGTAIACASFAWWKRRRVFELAPPPPSDLLRELESNAPVPLDDAARRFAVAELNQRLSDVAFELEILPSTFAALVRICLASGSALALIAFLTAPELPAMFRALQLAVVASAGFAGAVVVAVIGRSAKRLGREVRQKWDAASRGIGKALGTSLVAPESRDNSR